ncbi:caspase family protein [Runella sp. SP2]|uniref:caspase family protein n=1 Tax=Runella sp. SP2 TaxID=2268026 RepID=UPI000F07D007|nr:caspase family protein [Runella sp. SP2]AYQ36570.1 hypothetical protein DTQ70_30070 [Runella sp. SP2]
MLVLTELINGKIINRIFNNYTAFKFSPNNKYVALARLNQIEIWDQNLQSILSSSDNFLFKKEESLSGRISFDKNGNEILFEQINETIKRWDFKTGKFFDYLKKETIKKDIVEKKMNFKEQYSVIKLINPIQKDMANLWKISGGKWPFKSKIKNWISKINLKNDDKIDIFKDEPIIFSKFSSLAATMMDSCLYIWNTETNEVIDELVSPNGNWEDLEFQSDGTSFLVVTSQLKSKWISENNKWKKIKVFRSEIINSSLTSQDARIPFVDDNEYIATYDDNGSILLENKKTRYNRILRGHTGHIMGVAFSPNNQFMISVATDNLIKMWDLESGKEMVTYIPFGDKGWITITPSGLFDASANASELAHYSVQDTTDDQQPWKSIEFNQIRHRYYRPGLLPILFGYSSESIRSIPNIEAIPLPPSVELNLDGHELIVRVENKGGGIGRIAVGINENELISDLRPRFVPNNKELKLKINLNRFNAWLSRKNLNRLSVTAFNNENWVSSTPRIIEIPPINFNPNATVLEETVPSSWIFSTIDTLTKKKGIEKQISTSSPTSKKTPNSNEKLQIKALVVGASTAGLHFAHKDAEKVGSALSLVCSRMVGKENTNIQVLSFPTKNPTQIANKKSVIAALESAKNLSVDDIFILYLSGHGVHYKTQSPSNEDLYFLLAGAQTTDVTQMNDTQTREKYMLSFSTLRDYLQQIKASKKLVILDLCGAGQGISTLLSQSKSISEGELKVLEDLKERSGIYILASSASNKSSFESNSRQQGLATYAFLRGLRGGSSSVTETQRGNVYISVIGLLNYIVKEVSILANEIGVGQQAFFVKGAAPGREAQVDFNIGIVDDNIRSAISIEEVKPVIRVENFRKNTPPEIDELKFTAGIKGNLDKTRYNQTNTFAYVESEDYPGAFVLSGTYSGSQNNIILTYYLSKNGALIGTFTDKGKLEEVQGRVVQKITQYFSKMYHFKN